MLMTNDGLVVSVSRWTAPNGKNKGGKLYLLSDNSGMNPDIAGLELITPNMPYAMFEQFQGKALPAFYEILVSVERGAGGQDTEIVQSVAGTGQMDMDRVSKLFGVAADAKGANGSSASAAASTASPVPRPNILTGLAVSASRYDMEEDGGQKGGSVYFVQPVSGRSSNIIGMEVFRAKIPYDMFDKLQEAGLPGEYEFSARLTRRGGDKAALLISDVLSPNLLTRSRLNTLFGPVAPQPQPVAAKTTAAGA